MPVSSGSRPGPGRPRKDVLTESRFLCADALIYFWSRLWRQFGKRDFTVIDACEISGEDVEDTDLWLRQLKQFQGAATFLFSQRPRKGKTRELAFDTWRVEGAPNGMVRNQQFLYRDGEG